MAVWGGELFQLAFRLKVRVKIFTTDDTEEHRAELSWLITFQFRR